MYWRWNKSKKHNKRILSKFTVTFAFNLLKLEQNILPRLKPKLETIDVSHINYNFECPCQPNYIEESQLRLETRILQHRLDKNGAIYQHIQTCEQYNQSLTDSFTNQPSDSEQRSHFKSHFKILSRNHFSNTNRKLSERIHINLQQPPLNRQVAHKKPLLICNCLSKRIPLIRQLVTRPLEALSGWFALQNFLELIAYIITRTAVLCQTPEDVVNKTTKHVESLLLIILAKKTRRSFESFL